MWASLVSRINKTWYSYLSSPWMPWVDVLYYNHCITCTDSSREFFLLNSSLFRSSALISSPWKKFLAEQLSYICIFKSCGYHPSLLQQLDTSGRSFPMPWACYVSFSCPKPWSWIHQDSNSVSRRMLWLIQWKLKGIRVKSVNMYPHKLSEINSKENKVNVLLSSLNQIALHNKVRSSLLATKFVGNMIQMRVGL